MVVALLGKTLKLIQPARDAVGCEILGLSWDYRYNSSNPFSIQLGGKTCVPPCVGPELFATTVVLGIVSRILDISCDIFGIYRYQHGEYFRDISITISCDISNDIDMILHVNIHHK